jgi:hypothetical protein
MFHSSTALVSNGARFPHAQQHISVQGLLIALSVASITACLALAGGAVNSPASAPSSAQPAVVDETSAADLSVADAVAATAPQQAAMETVDNSAATAASTTESSEPTLADVDVTPGWTDEAALDNPAQASPAPEASLQDSVESEVAALVPASDETNTVAGLQAQDSKLSTSAADSSIDGADGAADQVPDTGDSSAAVETLHQHGVTEHDAEGISTTELAPEGPLDHPAAVKAAGEQPLANQQPQPTSSSGSEAQQPPLVRRPDMSPSPRKQLWRDQQKPLMPLLCRMQASVELHKQ